MNDEILRHSQIIRFGSSHKVFPMTVNGIIGI